MAMGSFGSVRMYLLLGFVYGYDLVWRWRLWFGYLKGSCLGELGGG